MKSSHFDKKGSARMVDISSKKVTKREAIATSKIFMKKKTFDMVKAGAHKKGDVLAIARIAAIMSVKKTHELIPLCHPLSIESVDTEFKLNKLDNSIQIYITVNKKYKS